MEQAENGQYNIKIHFVFSPQKQNATLKCQSAVSSKAKMTSSGGLDICQVKDLPLITPLETKQVNSKLIAACQTLTISRDSYGYLEHPVIKLLDKRIKLFFLSLHI